jgi:hypothetical protein
LAIGLIQRRFEMSRRVALAFSFSMTVVVAFAVASLASQAGWLQAGPGEAEVAAVEEIPAEAVMAAPSQPAALEPLVITEYVYQDVPVVVPNSQQAPTAPPAATAVPQPAQPTAQVEASGDFEQSDPSSRQEDQHQPAPQQSSSYHDDDGDDDAEEHEDEEEHEEHEDEDEHEEDDD